MGAASFAAPPLARTPRLGYPPTHVGRAECPGAERTSYPFGRCPPQTIDTLLRSLKRGDVAPAYYFYGAEDLLKEEAIRGLLDRVLDPGLRDFNLDQRSAAQADAEEVYSLCRTPAMMADRRVVVLSDVEAWKRKTRARTVVLDYLAEP